MCECDINMCQKICNISEETWKMEILSVEEHNISLALNDAPKSSCKKVLPAKKKLRNTFCMFNTSKIYSPSTILHMSPLDDAAHNMCSTSKKKNFSASSFKIY